MRKSRFATEQIVGFIEQAQAGLAVTELCRQNVFSDASCGWSSRPPTAP